MIGFDWLSQPGVQGVLSLVYTVLDILRIVVPIGLIVMTTMDIMKKVINPEDKEGQKTIMIRVIAAVIIFFIPTIINFTFNFLGIDIKNINMNKSSTPTITPTPKPTIIPTSIPTPIVTPTSIPTPIVTPTPTPTPKPTLNQVNITNCPDTSKKYIPGDKIILTTDIPADFKGEIKWIPDSLHNNFIITPSSDKRSATLEVMSNPISIYSTTLVSAGGKNSACLIFVQMLPSMSITNCPDKSRYFNPGDKIILTTDIPADYQYEIRWTPDQFTNNFIVTPSSDKRSAILEVISNPQSTFSTTTVWAGGISSACTININK